MEGYSNAKEGKRQMEIKTKDKTKAISFCNEHYQLSRIRTVKLAREIANGTQRSLSKWGF